MSKDGRDTASFIILRYISFLWKIRISIGRLCTAFSEPSFFLKNSNTSISAATFKSYFYQNRKGWMNYVKRCNIFLISASNISSVKNQVCELLNLSSYKFLFTSLFFAEVISPKQLGKDTPFIAFQFLETNG